MAALYLGGLAGNDLERDAHLLQQIQMCRQNLVEWIGGNQPDWRDLDHRAPRFAPLFFGNANDGHGALEVSLFLHDPRHNANHFAHRIQLDSPRGTSISPAFDSASAPKSWKTSAQVTPIHHVITS